MAQTELPQDIGRQARVYEFSSLLGFPVDLPAGWNVRVSPGGYYANYKRRWYAEVWKSDLTNPQSFRFNGRHIWVDHTICPSDVATIRQLAIFAMQATGKPLECGDIQTWYCLKAARII